jgi:1,4-alpha-glucan branching enzyme
VYFTLDAPEFLEENIYVSGMFNNYSLTDDYKMELNKKTGLYEKALLIKQGFTNYQYILTDKKGTIDFKNAIDGNYFQTENNYTAIVYYRGNNDRYDRVIGIANTNSEVIRN